ncbi:MAG: TRC40/GET3/ArsA family transport-energizing ATPase [Anaerolineae bacterium]|nr:TRC40/GET3/ArsA family transport-energizing ATPase [Anaerolineae bacterium]
MTAMSTPFVFFSGKGGVGKTSMACTTAVRYADEGRRTLIVTTDPASNLADVFEQPIGHKVTAIEGVPNLWAMEIDADRATEEYKDRALAPLRAAFPPQIVQVMEEQMNGPCTAEVAAFDRFTDFLESPGAGESAYDVVIFDTAPTGHTLRLLELPAEWSRSIQEAETGSGQTCIGPAAAIQDAKQKYERALAALRDTTRTTFVFVLHPEATAIKETQRATVELGKLDIHTHQIIVNGIIPPEESVNPFYSARMKMQANYLAQIERELPLPTQRMFLLDREIKGVTGLREVGQMLFDGQRNVSPVQSIAAPTGLFGAAPASVGVLGRVLPNSHSRTLFFAGKGGVGKTVASCLTAVWLARQGHKTLLLTTDPAAHLGDVLGVPVGDEVAPVAGVPNLWATKIDPKAAADVYKARILEDARQRGRPPEALQTMAEELDSPCTEEMAAFDRFIAYASQDEWQAIVFDTAPTGHTLRLLELPMDWSQQLDVKVFSTVDSVAADDIAKQRFGKVIAMMRDPERSTFAFVMYPESTPIAEAKRAIDELATLDISLGLVVANQVVPPDACTTPFARSRRTMQEKYLAEMSALFPAPMLQIPLLPHEVKGLDVLVALGEQVYGDHQTVDILQTPTEAATS